MKSISGLISAVWLLVVVGSAAGADAGFPPMITGVRPAECVTRGEQLNIVGNNFGPARREWRVALWDAGSSVELTVQNWRDTEITARTPSDARLKPGRKYQLRIEDPAGNLVGVPGPFVEICDPKPTAPAPKPQAVAPSPADATFQARQLAQMIYIASGGSHWKQARRIRFTYHAAQGDQPAQTARHEWDLRAGTDTVTWNDQTMTINVTKPGSDATAKAAHARWVNDTHWLLAPLRLNEPGVRLAYAGVQEVAGQKYDVLQTNYAPVGSTPSVQYRYFIDPRTRLVALMDYLPPGGEPVRATWETYQEFGGLKLATEHKFGEKRIWFTDIAVE